MASSPGEELAPPSPRITTAAPLLVAVAARLRPSFYRRLRWGLRCTLASILRFRSQSRASPRPIIVTPVSTRASPVAPAAKTDDWRETVRVQHGKSSEWWRDRRASRARGENSGRPGKLFVLLDKLTSICWIVSSRGGATALDGDGQDTIAIDPFDEEIALSRVPRFTIDGCHQQRRSRF